MANRSTRSLSARKELKDNLFENISKLAVADADENEFQKLSRRYLIDDSIVYGTASFYDFTREDERKKKIRICNGTACMVAGTQERVQQWAQGSFSHEEIGHVACVGHCHSNSAILYKDNTFSPGSEEELKRIVERETNQSQNPLSYEVGSNTEPVLTATVSDPVSFFYFNRSGTIKPPYLLIYEFFI